MISPASRRFILMESEPQAPSSEAIKLNHEPAELRVRAFVIFLCFFLIFAAGVHLFLWWLYGALHHPTPAALISPLIEQHPIPPEPVQQGSAAHHALPAEDLAAMRNREDQILNNYTWVDKSRGTV